MPSFQKIVNHARNKNLTLLHQDQQLQNIMTTTCGYFCLYFLNEMSKGTSYYDLLRVFDIHDTMKNERFIEKYFKIVSSIYIYIYEKIMFILFRSYSTDSPHYVNQYGCLECCNCEPISESDYESDSSSEDNPTYVPESD